MSCVSFWGCFSVGFERGEIGVLMMGAYVGNFEVLDRRDPRAEGQVEGQVEGQGQGEEGV